MSAPEKSLDTDWDAFEDQLMQAAALIRRRYETLEDANAHAGFPVSEVRGWFDEALPEAPADFTALLGEVDKKIIKAATLNIGTRMFSYVMSGGNQAGIIGDFIASAIDQNVTKWHLAPSLTEVERRVILWAADYIRMPNHQGGAIVGGGSAANLTGLTVGRNIFLEAEGVREKGLFRMAPLTVYASRETHSSIDKSVEFLGIGSGNYRKIPVRDDFTIDVDALKARIAADKASGFRPFCVVGNAGTVNTGAIDDLRALADVAEAEGMWFHVDGCYGGLAASLPEKAPLYDGMVRADSIALDFHKWLYAPFEIGCTLVRDWDQMKRTFHKAADYLDTDKQNGGRFDITEHHFDLSRSGKALKVWMSFKAYGTTALRDMIRKDIDVTIYLRDLIAASDDFEMMSNGPLAVTCFRYTGHGGLSEAGIEALNAALVPALEDDGRIFLTGTKLHGRQVLRACIINHRIMQKDIDFMLAVVRDVAETL